MYGSGTGYNIAMTNESVAHVRASCLRYIVVSMVTLLAGSCVSGPVGPYVSPEQHITVGAEFDEVWRAAIKLLREQELFIHTRDYPSRDRANRIERGRIEALKSAGRGLFRRYRQRLVIVMAAGPDGKQTAVAARVIAETYSRGLLSEPGWREQGIPDPSLAEDFLEGLSASLGGKPPAGSF